MFGLSDHLSLHLIIFGLVYACILWFALFFLEVNGAAK